jgi:hypothetical protein
LEEIAMAQDHKDPPSHAQDRKQIPYEGQYQGQKVHSVHEAKDGDLGFVKDTDQVLIAFEDTTIKVVKRSELTPPLTAATPPKPTK